ncbi:major facilitator superfamily transporter [Colletotrichum navitas]|uniref:Major facilitator superfamily transporter n=1 Tax=Colletotrichum navitas TaxID=681940 RepID=A0AAD8Q9A5_9PEZI|nr:major facilitator superfamily transporter [Colletotrichum navitas]KAK1596879.1 major facilitator superfamily transporter [Colletotrichum navitas]
MAAQTCSDRQISDHLSYPNPSLGDTAGFAASNLPSRPVEHSLASMRENRIHKFLIVTSLLLGLFLATLDTSIIATSLITISEEFNDYGNAPWVLLAYLLTYMGCAVGIAKFSDIYGRRTLLFCSWTVFLLFSLLCAAAASMPMLIVGRALQGIGGSGLYSLAQTCLLEHGPADNPPLMGALIGVTLAVAFLLGPVLGGAIVSKITWRWIFGINIPLGIAAMFCIALCYPRDRRVVTVFSLRGLKKIDFSGMATLFAASVFLVFAVERGGSPLYGWDHPSVITSFVVSGVNWVLFGISETYLFVKYCQYPDHVGCVHIEPVFPVQLAQRRPFMGGLAVTFLTGLPYVALTVIIPERMQVIEQETPLRSSLYLLPMLGACALGSFLAGAICSRSNNSALVMIVASVAQLIGISLMLIVSSVGSSFVPAYGFTFIFGLGVGLVFGSATILSGVETDSTQDHAVAQGALAQARALGSCLGVAVCTALFNKRLHALNKHLPKEQLAVLYQTPTASAHWNENLLRLIQNVYAIAFRDQIIFMIIACSLMVAAAVFTWENSPKPITCLASHVQIADKTSRQRGTDNDGTEMSDMGSVRSV